MLNSVVALQNSKTQGKDFQQVRNASFGAGRRFHDANHEFHATASKSKIMKQICFSHD